MDRIVYGVDMQNTAHAVASTDPSRRALWESLDALYARLGDAMFGGAVLHDAECLAIEGRRCFCEQAS